MSTNEFTTAILSPTKVVTVETSLINTINNLDIFIYLFIHIIRHKQIIQNTVEQLF